MINGATAAIPVVGDLLKAAIPVVGDVVKAIAPLLQPFADAIAKKIGGEDTEASDKPVDFSAPKAEKMTVTFSQ